MAGLIGADLFNNWRLREWLALFDPEATGYFMPTTDLPDGDAGAYLYLIAEDMTKPRSRVDQLSGVTWHEALAHVLAPKTPGSFRKARGSPWSNS